MQQSTETALHNVANDFLIASEGRLVSGLVLLDLSAFFDTTDHHIIIKKTGTCNWYQTNRTELVQVLFIRLISACTLRTPFHNTNLLAEVQACIKGIKTWLTCILCF